MGFVSMVNPFAWLTWIKIGAAAILAAWMGFKVGAWHGEGVGYAKRDQEVIAQVIAANSEIDKLHEALEDATAKLNAGRDQAALDVASNLKDIPASLRSECAAKCSMPAKARESLEAIR